jgi:hypothetical protein
MLASDRVLAGIVAAVVVLVAAAVVLTVIRPAAEYQSEDTPAGVVFNYLLALQRGDYDRAYGYLSRSLDCYPVTVTQFSSDLTGNYYMNGIEAKSWSVEQKSSTGVRATVSVSETAFRGAGLFEGGQASTNFDVDLVRPAQEWRIVYAGQYFNRWRWTGGCE